MTFTTPRSPVIHLNSRGERPNTYNIGDIKTLIHRTYRVLTGVTTFHASAENLKQSFVNNGYSNRMLNVNLRHFISNKHQQDREHSFHVDHDHILEVYYENHFSNFYKIDERIIMSIVYNNTSCVDNEDKLMLIIYYKANNVRSTTSRNNESQKVPKLWRCFLKYEFKCSYGESERLKNSFVGFAFSTLSRRLTMHLQGGVLQEQSTVVSASDTLVRCPRFDSYSESLDLSI